jgi:hypothetical protein
MPARELCGKATKNRIGGKITLSGLVSRTANLVFAAEHKALPPD